VISGILDNAANPKSEKTLDAPVSGTGQAYQVRHDKPVDLNQPIFEPLVL
jgi:hypothetical protein